MTWKPNCAVSKVRCLQRVCGPCFIQGHFLLWILGSGCGDVSLPYLWSHLDSVTLLMPSTPKIILSVPNKGIQNWAFGEYHFPSSCWILFVGSHLIPHGFKMTSHLLPNQWHNFTVYSIKEILLGLKRPPGPNVFSIAQGKLKKWIKILHKNKVNGQKCTGNLQ